MQDKHSKTIVYRVLVVSVVWRTEAVFRVVCGYGKCPWFLCLGFRESVDIGFLEYVWYYGIIVVFLECV
jgi:hypothetical protein